MKKNLTASMQKKLNDMVLELDGIENKIPYKMKTVFSFKGRKSPDIADKVIRALTEENAKIYDPFMGSGAFIIAAVGAGRKIVATELDNYTFDVVKTLFSHVDFTKVQEYFLKVESEVKTSIMELYATQCCGEINYISKLLYDPQTSEYFDPTPNREIIDGKNIKLVNQCSICGKKQKRFEQIDLDKINELNGETIIGFPTDKYIENSRINITSSTGADYYDRIFTNRNKKALLLLQNSINLLPACAERDMLEHALVSSLSLARIAMYGSSTDILYHVVPFCAQESNVWELFEAKLHCFINYKNEYLNLQKVNPCENDDYTLVNCAYQDYINSCVEADFDMVYTDFPYTDQVPYLERNQLYRIWLNTFYNEGNFNLTEEMLSKEMVKSNAPSRPDKQSIDDYYTDVDEMFKGFYKVLKSDGLVVLTAKLGKSKYFTTLIEIINMARKNGFEYISRIGIDKNDPSIRKQSAYKNTLSNEMIVIFEKLSEDNKYWYIGNKNYEFETVKIVYALINKTDSEITLSTAVRNVSDILRRKQSYITSESDLAHIASIIKNNFLVDSNSMVWIDCNKLYIDIEETNDLFTKLYDLMPIFINKLLEEKGRFVLDDLYFEIANSLCNGNPSTINQFLDDSSHQNDILLLLQSYCNTDGKVYERKHYGASVATGAIDISSLAGTDFELVIKSLLEAEGYDNVINTGGAGDLGVDLLAQKTVNGNRELYLFQCKRWASNVGSQPMQRLYSEKIRRNFDKAICITTSNYTEDGVKIAREMDIETVNGLEIVQRLNVAFPNMYYNGALEA